MERLDWGHLPPGPVLKRFVELVALSKTSALRIDLDPQPVTHGGGHYIL